MISSFKDDSNINKVCERIISGETDVSVSGLWGASKALFILALRKKIPNPILVVSEREDASEAFREDLQAFAKVAGGVSPDVFYQDFPQQSLVSLSHLCSGKNVNPVILTTIASIQMRIISREGFRDNSFNLNKGQTVDYEGLLQGLSSAGYERVDMVSRMGEFSARGQVVDIWSAEFERPARLVFGGEELEDIKWFDVVSQKSTGREDSIRVIPAKIFMELREKGSLIFNWLTENAVVILDNISSISVKGGVSVAEEFKKKTSRRISFIRVSDMPLKDSIDYSIHQQASFNADISAFLEQLEAWRAEGMSVCIFCNNNGEKSRLVELLNETAVEQSIPVPEVDFRIGRLNSGFVFPEKKLVLVTDAEIFNRYKIRHHLPKFRYASDFTELSDLAVNDFMVHERYGIGKYQGLKQMRIDDRLADYIILEYSSADKLYVPIEDFRLVQKFIGNEGYNPKLSSLDSTSWSQVKRKVKKSVLDIARDLLDVHAARQALAGHAFPADSAYEKEFAESFIYELTSSQKKAVDDVRQDMTQKGSMDRIVCGDVGYGKTEVAMRAALKAVLDGKQVAVLVPTTILAEQHFNTFSERFADYPVNIDMLSRFRSKQQQVEIVKRLKDGKLDIVIGTHRLVQKDISFFDLGLVVIDEEHRFGVKHKEKLKQMRKLVDVLTLTATPIPRTLSMAMGKVKSLSIIDTPPPERMPVETYAGEYNDDTVRVAITNEVNRGGQVFFVHDRVETIQSVAAHIQELVPGVRICHAHGQMPSRRLEKIMNEFIDKKFDLLVSTTIIESGLDIPNVNTIIISNAQKLGLAQMHQLRGRIGRDRYQAFCYLLYPHNEPLTDIAKKRLMTITQNTELGAGFRIAIKDLQIRGAGNLLGSRQHGHVMDVGFDLYCKLLGQAVEEMKTGKEAPEEEIENAAEIDLPLDAFIPMSYISSPVQRINIYRRLTSTIDRKGIDEIAMELEDRFGKIPPQCNALFEIIQLRQMAKQLEITNIVQRGDRVIIEFSNYRNFKPEKFSKISSEENCLIKTGSGDCFSIVINELLIENPYDIKNIKNVLQALI